MIVGWKTPLLLLALSVDNVVSYAVVSKPTQHHHAQLQSGLHTHQRHHHHGTSLYAMESDFGTAMPPKPEVSLEERLMTSAEDFVVSLRSSLGEGVAEPPELAALEAAIESEAETTVLATRIYELMIERGMLYDVAPETGTLTVTQFDIPSNLEEPAVKKEFLQLYTYGMGLIQRGLIGLDEAKAIIEKRLIQRTGLSPEEFDKWMGF